MKSLTESLVLLQKNLKWTQRFILYIDRNDLLKGKLNLEMKHKRLHDILCPVSSRSDTHLWELPSARCWKLVYQYNLKQSNTTTLQHNIRYILAQKRIHLISIHFGPTTTVLKVTKILKKED